LSLELGEGHFEGLRSELLGSSERFFFEPHPLYFRLSAARVKIGIPVATC